MSRNVGMVLLYGGMGCVMGLAGIGLLDWRSWVILAFGICAENLHRLRD